MTTPTAVNSKLVVRWATENDIARQADIERAWRHEKEDYWDGDALLAFLPSRRNPRGSLVAEHHVRGVVGHLQFTAREHDVALLNVATHPAYCHLGVASRMLGTLTSTLPARYRRRRVNAVVRERNLAAHLFLRAAGYRCHGILDSFFSAPDDNGYHFQYNREPPKRCQASDPRREAEPPQKS